MPKFSIGDVVTLKTHPFCNETTDVVISGEYLMIPPLMVVVEIIDHSVVDHGRDAKDKYKCQWFSTKKNQFKESYFLESDLKYIAFEKDNDPLEIEVGCLVALSTLPIELGKSRSFLNTETNQLGGVKSSSSVTGLLSFVSPIMTVTEIKDFESTKDKKTAPEVKTKKTYPKKLAKCKWFDSLDEKFSECLIAVDALVVLPPIPHELLKLVTKAIKDGKYLKLDYVLLRPIQITNRSGRYFLNCFNYISQQHSTLSFDSLTTSKIISNPIKTIAPLFKPKFQKGHKHLKLIVDIEDLIKKALGRPKKNYIVIRYRDRFGNVTKRSISKYEIILGDDNLNIEETMIKYVRAYCHLRKDERNFRLTSIMEATELKFNYDVV